VQPCWRATKNWQTFRQYLTTIISAVTQDTHSWVSIILQCWRYCRNECVWFLKRYSVQSTNCIHVWTWIIIFMRGSYQHLVCTILLTCVKQSLYPKQSLSVVTCLCVDVTDRMALWSSTRDRLNGKTSLRGRHSRRCVATPSVPSACWHLAPSSLTVLPNVAYLAVTADRSKCCREN